MADFNCSAVSHNCPFLQLAVIHSEPFMVAAVSYNGYGSSWSNTTLVAVNLVWQ